MNTFSFCAARRADMEHFLTASVAIWHWYSREQLNPPAETFEGETTATIETIRDIMREVPGGRAMIQTLRECPLSDNSLERGDGLI
ncbi:hypothetical protein [Paraburkholderia sp. A1RO-5L]|uniref:hypothetical protein n=1 Tax=Paraburkholderia sp. A1RO-5L TaxID=3028370 RepID=UPI003B7C3286